MFDHSLNVYSSSLENLIGAPLKFPKRNVSACFRALWNLNKFKTNYNNLLYMLEANPYGGRNQISKFTGLLLLVQDTEVEQRLIEKDNRRPLTTREIPQQSTRCGTAMYDLDQQSEEQG